MDEPDDSRLLRFGDFELDVAQAQLRRAGALVALPPKSYELLVFLARRPAALVLKDELLDAVWGRRFVSEGAVKTVVSELRAALGDDARAPRWIETVQRRGYRFKGEVQTGPAAPTPLATVGGAASTAPGNLPTALPPLIGRDDDLAALSALLESEPLVTLTGPGGVGKTRLALAAAQARRGRHPGGVWLLELAPLAAGNADAATLGTALARTLLIGPVGADSEAGLVRALQGLSLLLVIDNAEHVLAGLATWLVQVQPHLPGLRLLVTSREPLQVPAERVYRVAPLTPPQDDDAAALQASSAVRLFVDRVAARLNGFVPGPGQQQAIGSICRALDGLPLALELAAARVPVLGVHGMAEHLMAADEASGRLQLLTQGARTAAPHQRTLRATLDWSHALLTPGEQRVFRRLAVFRAGFTLATAQQVCADGGLGPWAVVEHVTALVEKSMVVGAQADAVPARFGLLHGLREYAWERLEAAGEVDTAMRSHLLAARALWAAADAKALDEPVLPWATRLEPELDNLRSVLAWAAAALAAREDAEVADAMLALVAASAKFWPRAGLAAEGGRWCLALRERAERHADVALRAGIDMAMANLTRFTPLLSPAEGLAVAQRAVDAYARLGEVANEYVANYLAWGLALEIGEEVDRQCFVERMKALVRPDWNPLRMRWFRIAWGQELRLRGDVEGFLEASREDMASARAAGAQAETWMWAYPLMLAEHDHGHADRALALGKAVLDDIRAAGRLRSNAQLLCLHTAMRADHGDVDGTRAALVEALPMLLMMAACELLFLAMAWLAAHEQRDEDALQVLAWFESPRRGGGVYGPRTFTRRSADALASRLRDRLPPASHEALRQAGEGLGNELAVRIGTRAPGTDADPTVS